MKKYFYFRTVSDVANDDASGDSVLVDVDNLSGFHGLTDNGTVATIAVLFKSINNINGGSGERIIKDQVVLNCSTAKRRQIIQALAEATNNGPHEDGIITIADDVTGVYLHSDITSCGTITQAAQV